MIVVLARMRIKPGFQTEIKALALSAIEATRKEQGNISYSLLQDPYDDCEFCFVEEWQDQAALKAHTQSMHFLKWREQGAHMVADRTIKVYSSQEVSL